MDLEIILMFFVKWDFWCEIICFGSGIQQVYLFVYVVFSVDVFVFVENCVVKCGDDLLSFWWLDSWWCIGVMNVVSYFQRVMNCQVMSYGYWGFLDVVMILIFV